MELTIYNQKGEKSGSMTLPDAIFGVPWNGDLIHQAVVALRSNIRTRVANTKDRSEVSGGGRKPWRQKGTGRARHGSRRSPLWRGGGITFGPRSARNFSRKLNKKMYDRALCAILSEKARRGEMLFLDSFSMNEAKTSSARKILDTLSAIPGFDSLATKKKNNALIFLPEENKDISKSFKNLGNIAIMPVKEMNILDVLNFKSVIIVDPQKSLASLKGRTYEKIVPRDPSLISASKNTKSDTPKINKSEAGAHRKSALSKKE